MAVGQCVGRRGGGAGVVVLRVRVECLSHCTQVQPEGAGGVGAGRRKGGVIHNDNGEAGAYTRYNGKHHFQNRSNVSGRQTNGADVV